MATKVRRIQTRYLGMLDKNMAHRRRAAQRTEWRHHLDEDVPGRRVPRPAVAQVKRQRLGHRRQHGEREANTGLCPHQLDGAAAQSMSSNFSRIASPAPRP